YTFANLVGCSSVQTNGSGAMSCGSGASNWTVNNGAIAPKLAGVLDFLIGGTATNSGVTNFAKFAVLNVNSGTPTASVAAGLAGGAYLTATGTLQTTAQQTLTIGGPTTGNVI